MLWAIGPCTGARLRDPAAPKHRDEFEIAIICALTLEAEAVDALFDKYWSEEIYRYGKAQGDPNSYTTGAIGHHNVVLAHMPGMGKVSAGMVAASCRTSFPNIKLALVVGICGAAPIGTDKEDILLGDVIISEGVVQYDFGRQFPDRFDPKTHFMDVLGRPNTEIRSFMNMLKIRRYRDMLREKMSRHLASLGDTAQHPGAAADRLFESAYRHKHQDPGSCPVCAAWKRDSDPVCDLAASASCEQLNCDEKKSVPRHRIHEGLTSTAQISALRPEVHFGLIASGDTVMKSGKRRDELAKNLKVIAFEMEGAGVSDNLPCVVVKGVCDYGDSHKNKKFQKYAATTAATCMKALLEILRPSVIPDAHRKAHDAGPWFLVPYSKNTAFVGRHHILERLRKRFGHGVDPQGEESHTRAALYGLGGSGKTQIALSYAYWIKDIRPDVSVFWVHASNAQRFRQSFLSIAEQCRVPGYSDESKADALQLVKKWLEGEVQRPWIMVIDNADDTELFFGSATQDDESIDSHARNETVGRYIPECPHGSILITTRNKETGVRLTQTRQGGVIDVGRMDEEEAVELFRKRLKDNSLASDELSDLSSGLEYLPLALVQAAAFMQENTITAKRYIQLLETTDVTLLLNEPFETDGRDSETRHPVIATWMISFDQIRRQNLVASDLLSLMCYFDRQDIPRTLLSQYNERRDSKEGGYKTRRGAEVARALQLEKALGVLKAFSFVTESRDETFTIHRLVQLAMRNWLSTLKQSEEFVEKALVTLSNVYPEGVYENRIVCDQYLPHAMAVLSLAETSSKKESLAKASLLHRVAEFLHYRGYLNQVEDLQKQALEMRSSLLGNNHADTLATMASLAQTYRSLGRLDDAERYGIQAMEKRKAVLGKEDPDTLASVASLAWTFRIHGRWDEAEKLGQLAMETRKRVLGEGHPDTLTSMANLAGTYRIQGRWKEAEKLGERCMAMRIEVLGTEHPDTLTSMVNLAAIYMSQGRWKDAEELERRAVEIGERTLGTEHPDTLKSMADLAWTYVNQDRWNEAQELTAYAVDKLKVLLGTEHPDTLVTMANLAWTYRSQGKLEEAQKLQLEVVQTRTRVLGTRHPDTLRSISSLASIYKNRGQWREAEELELQVMETRKQLLGAEHPDTLGSMSNLAWTYKNQGRLEEAEELEIQTMEARQKTIGAEHPSTLRSMERLALTYKRQGRWEAAGQLESQVLQTRRKLLGAEHPETLASIAKLAKTYKNQGLLEEAGKLETEVAEIEGKMLGGEHPDTSTNNS